MSVSILEDWSVAQSLYNQGFSLAEIARKIDCNAGTLRSYATRHSWSQIKRDAANLASPKIVSLDERANRWRSTIADEVDKQLADLQSKKRSKPMSLKELREYGEVLDLADKIARRTYGLDQADQSVCVNVAVVTQLHEPSDYQSDVQPVVDVESQHVTNEDQGS